jgi:hypothetical protein
MSECDHGHNLELASDHDAITCRLCPFEVPGQALRARVPMTVHVAAVSQGAVAVFARHPQVTLTIQKPQVR